MRRFQMQQSTTTLIARGDLRGMARPSLTTQPETDEESFSVPLCGALYFRFRRAEAAFGIAPSFSGESCGLPASMLSRSFRSDRLNFPVSARWAIKGRADPPNDSRSSFIN